MAWERLLQKKEQLHQIQKCIPQETIERMERSFDVEYAHNSTAIDGNTLTLLQTSIILEERLSVGGKTLREIYEVANHAKAFACVKKCVSEGLPLDGPTMRDIHALLMANIVPGGIYRNVEVRISGAGFQPPAPDEMYRQIKNFVADLLCRTDLNAIELATWTHAEFVKIHPFVEGNGCTARMLMNYQLMSGGFLPISIAKEDWLEYFAALKAYAVDGDPAPFAKMVAALEEVRLDEYLAIGQTQVQQRNNKENERGNLT